MISSDKFEVSDSIATHVVPDPHHLQARESGNCEDTTDCETADG